MRHEESPNQGHVGVVNEEERKNMRSVKEIDLNMGGEQKEGSVKTRDFDLGDKVNNKDIKVGIRRIMARAQI